MDSPLNRAHQQERKAEKLILSKKYMEAVTCYEIAAGYITEAMKVTTASQAVVSMQLQYQDHLRKQRILKSKIQRLGQVEQQNLQDIVSPKDTSGEAVDGKDSEHKNIEVSTSEQSNSSGDSSLSSSQGVLVQAEDAISSQADSGQSVGTSVDDLQMQVLSLTQALEDSNRENNHLRNIVLKFKEVLHIRLGFSEDEIEDLLIDPETDEQEHSCVS